MSLSGEWRWVLGVSLAIVLLSSVPYVFGYAIAPESHRFIGLTHNVDDALVYLSWMRQAADGHFFTENLFTTEAQTGRGFNLLFYALGRLADVAHLPLIVVFHSARIIFGVALLALVYMFAGLWTNRLQSKRLALVVTGISAGLGWLIPTGEGINRSVDLWQPEAITFLSIYLSPLFSFSMILMVASLHLLYLHRRTGRIRHAVLAGLLLLLLGNVHSYDVIPIALTWLGYAIVSVLSVPSNARPIFGGLVAAAIGSPAVIYQAYTYLHEPVFRMRADVPTLSPGVVCYLLGFGLLIPLAVAGVCLLRADKSEYRLLLCWALAAFVAAYLPVAFQRKLIMGIHVPLSILAAVGLASLASRAKARPALVLTLGLLLLVPSNAIFAVRDMGRVMANEPHTTAHPPFVSTQELNALEYIRRHARPGDIILAQPWFASLVPAHTGVRVYCGHWGETARFEEKLQDVWTFFSSEYEPGQRTEFLVSRRIRYVVDCRQLSGIIEDVMLPVFSSGDTVVYRVR